MDTNLLFLNLKINKYFYLNVLISMLVISSITKCNFYNCLLSFIFISSFGYFIHAISHIINFRKLLTVKHPLIQKKKFQCIYSKFVNLIEFHTITHHNSMINREIKNIISEALNNVFFQGLGLFLLIYLIKQLNINIFILWAFLYTTIHLINYNINHHKDSRTNYGIDIYDIIFGTKNENDSYVENYNHYSYNLFILTILYIYIYKMLH